MQTATVPRIASIRCSLGNPFARLLEGSGCDALVPESPPVGVGVSTLAFIRLGVLTVVPALDRVLSVKSCTVVVGSTFTLGHRVAVSSGMLDR